MKRTALTEFKAGYESGRQHRFGQPLHDENLGKIQMALAGEPGLIRHYWMGYQAGLAEADPFARAVAEGNWVPADQVGNRLEGMGISEIS